MRPLLLAPLILLAACGSGGEEAGNNSSSSVSGSLAQAPENLMDDPQNTLVPVEPPLPTPTSPPGPLAAPEPAVQRSGASVDAAPATPGDARAFPAGFQGRWGLVANDCKPGRPDAKGLVEVGPTTLRFYESRGTVTDLKRTRPARLQATLSYAGEGQNWTAVEAYTLLQDGKTLVRETRDPAKSLRYHRCPDQA